MRLLALFLLAWSAVAAPPTPASFFGHPIGADRTVLDWDKVVNYYKALAASSDRIKVEELGKTMQGRPFIAVFISDASTIKNLDKVKDAQARLADPRKTTPQEAEKLIADSKIVAFLTCTIHADEIASSHTALEFVYNLITQDTPRNRAILQNELLIVVPSLNPDGMDYITKWYRSTLNTPYEGTYAPEVYNKYVGHDDNRDWYIFTQAETRHTVKLQNTWHPAIVYDVHQMGPNGLRLYIPPYLDPFEPNVDPIILAEQNMIGTSMAADETINGKTGIAINAVYDFYTPARAYQAFHAGLRILTESASVKIATPITVKREEIDKQGLGYDPQKASWNYLQPWLGGSWKLRDIVDYQMIAFESCFYNTAIHKAEMMRGAYHIQQHQVTRKEPWGFVVSANQRDPGATRKLLETLQFGLVEVGQASDGSAVIPMQQPYSGWAKALLEKQNYPNDRVYPGGPPKHPYDVTAQTLPMLMGVDVKTVTAPVAASGQWKAKDPVAGPLLKAADHDSWTAINRAWANGKQVFRNPANGDFSLTAQAGFKEVKRPRLAMYHSYTDNQEEGWTRWLFDTTGFAFTSLYNKDMRAGGLKGKFDVIVFEEQTAKSIEEGVANLPEEYRGGIGPQAAAALKEFAQAGGTLIFINNATDYAIEKLGVQATRVKATIAARGGVAEASDFFCPGSLLNVHMDAKSPLVYGVPTDTVIWAQRGPAWDTQLPVIARYPASNLLASGWLVGEKEITGKAALVDAPMGSGHVVLFGMRPHYRGQSLLTEKLLFNAIVR